MTAPTARYLTPGEQELMRHWRQWSDTGMSERYAWEALAWCLTCWEIARRLLWIFGIRLDRSRMPK